MNDCLWKLVCVDCGAEYDGFAARHRCDCGGTLDVIHDLSMVKEGFDLEIFDRRLGSRQVWDRSGVWRFSELILPIEPGEMVTLPEGNTNLYTSPLVTRYTGLDGIYLKHEGENPTASFKDRGMTVGISMAKKLAMRSVACASTGNTSASMAAYAARAGLRAVVFIPRGKIAFSKLSQALAFGARTIQIEGDFDAAMKMVEQVCARESIYLLNSVNPFRVEGQKSVLFELLQDLQWQVPDWIVLPGGNLGNNSAVSKGLDELHRLGLIDRLPRLAVIQASGANPLYTAYKTGRDMQAVEGAETLATAIKIGNPVSWRKSLRGIRQTDGVVEQVSDQEIFDAKAHVDAAGIGAEPASCASVAGTKKLVEQGVIGSGETVCCILTGHLLKDPDAAIGYHRGELEGIESRFANTPVSVPARLDDVLRAIEED